MIEKWSCLEIKINEYVQTYLKIILTNLKFNKYCIHSCFFLVLYTLFMRTMLQTKK